MNKNSIDNVSGKELMENLVFF